MEGDSMTYLDILQENECINKEKDTTACKAEEEYFYRGGKVTWLNFYLSEMQESLPFIKRDKYEDLNSLIKKQSKLSKSLVCVNLFHYPGCGGTTLAKHVLWDLRKTFKCAVLNNNFAKGAAIAGQVLDLFVNGGQKQTVLLLVDDLKASENIKELQKYILDGIEKKNIHRNSPVVIILSCIRSESPVESMTTSFTDSVCITNKLSEIEQSSFEKKLQEIQKSHENHKTFYGFLIMRNDFKKSYVEDVVQEMFKDRQEHSKEAQLISFLALLNSYVSNSSLLGSVCESFLRSKDRVHGSKPVEEQIKPFSGLLIHFKNSVKTERVRMAHKMIATQCCEELEAKEISRSKITKDLLSSLFVKKMDDDPLLMRDIQDMLVTRQKSTKFSQLIEDIRGGERSKGKCIAVLTTAAKLFVKSAVIPQALARFYYIIEKNYSKASEWAKCAKERNENNSFVADTLGQVYKYEMKQKQKHRPDQLDIFRPDQLDIFLSVAKDSIDAFQEEQVLAKKEGPVDLENQWSRKRPSIYNTNGLFGELQVASHVFYILSTLHPLEEEMKKFLRYELQIDSICKNDNNKQFLQILKKKPFLTTLKSRVKIVFGFYESYLTYSKPSQMKEESGYIHKEVADCFLKYTSSECNSNVETEAVDQNRKYLEAQRAASFPGLLHCLSERNYAATMEKIKQSWQCIYNSSTKTKEDDLNFILANIVLNCINPGSVNITDHTELEFILKNVLSDEKEDEPQTSAEMYFLALVLLWPQEGTKLYVEKIWKCFQNQYELHFRSRFIVPHFFLGQSSGLNRVVHKSKIDTCFNGFSETINMLWHSGEVWKNDKVKKLLCRVEGRTEGYEVFAQHGKVKIRVQPDKRADVRNDHKVSFFLGFSIKGPVAYDIQYHGRSPVESK